jgi:hypothetical protein
MSDFRIPLPEHDLIHQLVSYGGKMDCPLQRLDQRITASLNVTDEGRNTRARVVVGDYSGEILLNSALLSNHLRLRNFIEDMANGRIESGRLREPNVSSVATPSMPVCDAEDLETLIDAGGFQRLSTGHMVTVHRGTKRITGIIVSDAGTHIVSGSPNDLRTALTEHIESQLIA